jgi:hypothetical protein
MQKISPHTPATTGHEIKEHRKKVTEEHTTHYFNIFKVLKMI